MKWTAADIPALHGKTALVTGANNGLGFETAVALAGAGATLVMACRDPARGSAALAEVRRRAPDNANVELMALDLADLASIRRFAQETARKHPRLDILCNNAGVMALPFQKTKDGFEMQVGTNHLGHFALTGLLFDSLAAAPAARVVNVASLAHRWFRGFDPDDLNFERRGYSKWVAYSHSKLANLLFTFELQRRLQSAAPRIAAIAAHPGYTATNLMFVGPAQEKSALSRLVMQIGNALFAQNATMGALPTLYAATMPDVAGGDYIGPDGFQQMKGYPRKVGCHASARDAALGARLWAASEKLTGVRYLAQPAA
jgi:NAD(P)-dependent dehydrogenase (short-subunit alcohol dehydrogenase family)